MTSPRAQGLGDRIRIAAQDRAQDAQRLRRGLVFQRLLARLAPHGLVLKGGYCLEVRLGQIARTTQDIDLVGWLALASDPDDLLDALEGAMLGDFDDGFSFRVAAPRRLRGEEATSPAWRVPVEALVDGAHFAHIKLDLVGQLDEVEGATELIEVRAPIAAPTCGAVSVTAVDVYQHAAEKLHAYSRLYAGGRPSSRVKDLVDLVLLIDAGLLVDARRLGTWLAVVWSVRDRTQPPASLPSPPPTWADDMARLLGGHGPPDLSLSAAHDLVATLYASAIDDEGTSA
ncbi:nucleotidyl transferase AbiEii/AbiGii toxin family protein [Janibacter sp. FSL W8-0316]|uniref:nucleotidyl transferase AbiEii/AbiGii toxin family protein n=1 Tax=Janibacter sp. FSL W8-0316 TaxID=2975325 RepID=UPI0030FC3743